MIRTFAYDKQLQKVPVRSLRQTIVTDNIIKAKLSVLMALLEHSRRLTMGTDSITGTI